MARAPGLPDTTRRTKIVCTLGPASGSGEIVEKLVRAGMNVARVNCSHGDAGERRALIHTVRKVARRLRVSIPVLLDLSGPKMRIGRIASGSADLRPGDAFTLTRRRVKGDWQCVSVNYRPLIRALSRGDRILMGDGEIELRVVRKTADDARCEVVVGGTLMSNKGINAPGVRLRERVPTRKDLADARLGMEEGVEWVALSFVRAPEEVIRLRRFLRRAGSQAGVIVKIEKREALERVDALLAEADGMMIARGDLGLELPIHEVPLAQKDLVAKSFEVGKPVITATQMLESMIHNPRPTRAEAADIANAVFDGTDAVMLSGETAAGRHPVAAVKTMAEIAEASERRIDYADAFYRTRALGQRTIPDAISRAACATAIETAARLIICCTRTGFTVRYVSNYRPPAKIVVASPNEETLRRCMLMWNTHPVKTPYAEDSDRMVAEAKRAVLRDGVGRKGDRIVLVAGVPIHEPATTNVIKADVL
jgi:pyruvate kinase